MNTNMTQIYQSMVDYFGTQEQTANAIGIKQPSVNALVNGRAKMSPKVAIRAEKATKGKFKAVDLCPSLKEFAEQQQLARS